MARVRVSHLREDAFEIQIRGHTLLVDQRSPDREAGPTPVELFVASLGACAAYHAESYLRREGLPRDGLAVDCTWTTRPGDPPHVDRVRLRLRLCAAVPPERRAELITAVEACTVHDALVWPPNVTIEISEVPPVRLDVSEVAVTVPAW